MMYMYVMAFFLSVVPSVAISVPLASQDSFISLLQHIHTQRKKFWVPACFSVLKAVLLSSVLQNRQQLRTPTPFLYAHSGFEQRQDSLFYSNKPVLIAPSHRYLEKEEKSRMAFLTFQKSTALGKFRSRSCMFEFTSPSSIFLLLNCPCQIICP